MPASQAKRRFLSGPACAFALPLMCQPTLAALLPGVVHLPPGLVTLPSLQIVLEGLIGFLIIFSPTEGIFKPDNSFW